MKRLLALVLLAALLAGCGKSDRPAAVDSTAPVDGGELVFAFDGAGSSQFPLDPANSAYAPHHRIMRSVFDSLVVALPGHRFGPWLAKRWDISEDGRRYVFHLRGDVKFHDGTRFDAQAVKANLDRIREPRNALVSAPDLGSLRSVEVVDDFTVALAFAQPYAPLLAQLSKTNFGLVSPAALAQWGERVASHPVGTGPFKLVGITQGTEVRLERNADYRWPPEGSTNAGPAHLQALVFKNVPEEATRVAVLQNGQAQAADLIPPQNLVALRRDPAYTLVEGELLNHNYALFLNVGRAPWNDAAMRRAFRQSLDLDAAVRTIHLGNAARAWSPLSPSLFGYDRTLENAWKPDRAAAARALDERGWKPGADGIREKDGKRLSLEFLDSQGNREKRLDLLTLLRRQLRDNGIELRIVSQPGGNLLEKVRRGDYDLAGASQFAPDPDVLRKLYTPTGRAATAYLKVDDPELSRWLDEAAASGDEAERARLYGLAQHRIVEATYAIPTYVLTYTVAESDRAHGITLDVHGFPQFQQAWVTQP